MFELPMRSIKGLRIDKFMTQEDMAKKLSLNRATYSKYENLETHPDVLIAMDISRILDYPVERIIWSK